MPAPKSRRFANRRAEIIAAAVSVINRKGIRGMTFADVGERLGIVPSAVVYYFDSKEALAQACFLRAIERLNELIDAASIAASPHERVGLFLKEYFLFRRRVENAEAEAITVFNDVHALNSKPVTDAYIAMFRRMRSLLTDSQNQDWTHARINACTHLLMTEVFWAVAWVYRHDLDEYPRIADCMWSISSEGITSNRAAWRPAPLPDLFAVVATDPNETYFQAATQLINEEGYIGASVDKISARLKVTKGAFYYRHETKEELVIACFERSFKIMREAVREAEKLCDSAYETLITAACGLITYQVSNSTRLLRTSALTSVPVAAKLALLEQFERITLRFASLISDGIAEGSVRAVDAHIAAQMLTGMINGAAELHFWVKGVSADIAIETYTRPFFEGLLPASRP